jgi:phosphohistidine phosphatase SixA
MRSAAGFLLAFAVASATAPLGAQTTATPSALVPLLRLGGYVLLMRHASSPRELPDERSANIDNVTFERQLDEAGRAAAATFGKALRELKIPIAAVLTSPTYRARETVVHAGLANLAVADQLGDNGQSMGGVTSKQAEWLRRKAAEEPRGGNVLLVTHTPNLERAFPEWGASVAEGEIVVMDPDGRGGSAVVGRIKIQDWPALR